MDGIIESLIPKYISKSVRTYVKDYVKNNFKSEQTKKSKLHKTFKIICYILIRKSSKVLPDYMIVPNNRNASSWSSKRF